MYLYKRGKVEKEHIYIECVCVCVCVCHWQLLL